MRAVAQKALQQYLQDDAEQKMQQEIAAYHLMHPTLWQEYHNQYVAIHQGELVDHDVDQHALYLRIHQRYPNEVILIRQVLANAEPSWMLRTPKFN